MCGFVGYFNLPAKLNPNLPDKLRRASVLLRHRGPDQIGEYFDESKLVGMGFNRLSIIDLTKSGRQPMFNEDESLILTFNGEIYNYLELRGELLEQGHEFKSRTDSEVLLHLYEQVGSDMLSRLDGMFSFVLYDRSTHELFAARDRFGQKPFYYAFTSSGLYWASEFRTLAYLVPENLNENLQGFYHYVTFNCYPREFTFFHEIRKLLPGHSLRFKLDMKEPQIQQYYTLRLRKNSDDQTERNRHLRKLFSSAVKKRLMSEVPIGFYLSGGIDSSSIVMQASKFHSPVSTFSIMLESDPIELDETPYARLVAERCNSNHFEVRLTEHEYVESMFETAWALDEPVNLADAILLNRLTKLAASLGIKVLMSGEGSDEVFFGYPHYYRDIQKYYKYLLVYQFFPAIFRDMLKAGMRATFPNNFGRIHRWLRGRERLLGGDLGLTDEQKNRFLANRILKDKSVVEWSEILSVRLQRQLELDKNSHVAKQIMLNEFNIRLPDLLMMRIDKITMANSVEARNPYLDRELVEYAISLSFDELFDGENGKLALRRALKPLLPSEIINRKKMGFGGSLDGREKPTISAFISEIISGCSFLDDYFRREYLDSLIAPSNEQDFSSVYASRNVVMFALWKQQLDCLISSKKDSVAKENMHIASTC